jgi:hypothetical protein
VGRLQNVSFRKEFKVANYRAQLTRGRPPQDVQPSKARQAFEFNNLLENPPNLVGPIGAEDHQEPYGNFFRQSDRNFLVNIPGVCSDVNRHSGHSAVFYFSVSELPDVDTLAFTFA